MSTNNNSNHVRAYVFIKTNPGTAWDVVQSLERKQCVSQVDVINGPYNVIAMVEGENASPVAVEILTGIRKAEGVKDVVVYLAEHKEDMMITLESPDETYGSNASKLLKK